MATPPELRPAFSFSLGIEGAPKDEAAGFQEVSGLEADVETIAEGGENRFVHRLPKPVKHANLTLRRGIVRRPGVLAAWLQATLVSGLAEPSRPKALEVALRDETGAPIITWRLANAYPVKWSVGDFSAKDDAIAVETIEFAFTSLARAVSAP